MRTLRIAEVPTIDYQVPPIKYGAVHSLVYDLSKHFADNGHKVTVFADAESKISHPNVELAGIPVEKVDDPVNPYRRAELLQFLEVYKRQAEFDVIHWHYDPIALNCQIDGQEFNFLEVVKTTPLITLHFAPSASGPLFDAEHRGNMGFYEYHKQLWDKNFISISNAQRRGVEFLNFKRNIYHGIDLAQFKFNPTPEDYVLFIGRITPEKGIVQAIQAARLAGKKLKIGAKVEDKYQQFFQEQVQPLLNDPLIEYLGEVGVEQKVELYANASATLFPISWEEPFGLVMIESLASGTPVIGFGRGSVPEVIENGKTGFIVDNVEQMAVKITEIGQIERQACRQAAEERFSVHRMVSEYSQVLEELLD